MFFPPFANILPSDGVAACHFARMVLVALTMLLCQPRWGKMHRCPEEWGAC